MIEYELRKGFIKFNIMAFFALLGSVIIKLSNENGANFKSAGRKLIPYGIGTICLILYRVFYLVDFTYISFTRNLGMTILLVMGIFLIQGINKKDKYEFYFWDVLKAGLIGICYSTILFLGISFFISILRLLFEIQVDTKYYVYSFYISFILVFNYITLSKMPEVDEKYNKREHSKVLMALMRFILIPLSYIYTVILYMYFLKVSTDMIIPKGIIAHLIIWYSVISIAIIFITRNYDGNKSISKFNTLLPKFNLPLLIILFFALYLRINEYGFTENRYYVLLVSIWIFISMFFYSFKGNKSNIVVVFILWVFVLLSQVGPISAYNISRISQEKRFNRVLVESNILQGNDIVKNSYATEKQQKEISNILYYFDTKHSLDDIKILPEGFSLNNMYFYFGFKYDPDTAFRIWSTDRYYFNASRENKIIDVAGYSNYIELNSSVETELESKDFKVKLNMHDLELEFQVDEKIKLVSLERDLNDIYENIKANNTTNLKKNSKIKIDNVEINIIYKDVNAWIDEDGVHLNSIDLILLSNSL